MAPSNTSSPDLGTPRRRANMAKASESSLRLHKAEAGGASPASSRNADAGTGSSRARGLVAGLAALVVVAGFVAVAVTGGTDAAAREVRRFLSWSPPISGGLQTPPVCTNTVVEYLAPTVAAFSEWVEPEESQVFAPAMTDDSQGVFQLGFTFDFYCRSITELSIHDNGILTLFPTTGRTANPEHFAQPGETISPYHFDLDPSRYWGGGKVTAVTTGSPGSRVATITWSDMPAYRYTNTDEFDKISFQVRLYEGSNHIRFNYRDMTFLHAPLALSDGRKGISSIVPHESFGPRPTLIFSAFKPNLPSGTTLDFTPSGQIAPPQAAAPVHTCAPEPHYTVVTSLPGSSEWFEPITHWDVVRDDTHYEINVPWAVQLFCGSSNKLYVTDNGIISFNPLPGREGVKPRWNAQFAPVENTIAVLWMDMFRMDGSAGEPGRLFVDITGDAGSRTLTITWENAYPFYTHANKKTPNQPTTPVTFQARFCEATGAIRFNYKDVDSTDLSDRGNLGLADTAIVGLGGTQEAGILQKVVYQAAYSQHVVGGPRLQDGLSIDFIPDGQSACPFEDVCTGDKWGVTSDKGPVAMLPEGPALSGVTDDSQISFDLCFDFKFQCGCTGETIDKVWISTNGLVRTSEHPCYQSTFHQDWRSSPPRNSFAPLWTDWATWIQSGSCGAVHAHCYDNGGSKVAVITWKDVEQYGDVGSGNPAVSFQMQLHEDGRVVYVYDNVANHPESGNAMVGIGGRVDSESTVHTLPLSNGESLTWQCSSDDSDDSSVGPPPSSCPDLDGVGCVGVPFNANLPVAPGGGNAGDWQAIHNGPLGGTNLPTVDTYQGHSRFYTGPQTAPTSPIYSFFSDRGQAGTAELPVGITSPLPTAADMNSSGVRFSGTMQIHGSLLAGPPFVGGNPQGWIGFMMGLPSPGQPISSSNSYHVLAWKNSVLGEAVVNPGHGLLLLKVTAEPTAAEWQTMSPTTLPAGVELLWSHWGAVGGDFYGVYPDTLYNFEIDYSGTCIHLKISLGTSQDVPYNAVTLPDFPSTVDGVVTPSSITTGDVLVDEKIKNVTTGQNGHWGPWIFQQGLAKFHGLEVCDA